MLHAAVGYMFNKVLLCKAADIITGELQLTS